MSTNMTMLWSLEIPWILNHWLIFLNLGIKGFYFHMDPLFFGNLRLLFKSIILVLIGIINIQKVYYWNELQASGFQHLLNFKHGEQRRDRDDYPLIRSLSSTRQLWWEQVKLWQSEGDDLLLTWLHSDVLTVDNALATVERYFSVVKPFFQMRNRLNVLTG